MNENQEAFQRLVTIVDELREQCPWDKKQTIESLRYLTIEETYELGDAILEKDMKGIREELGDLMMHLIFYARIGREQEAFTLSEVLHGISEKLIHRHPHIYGDVKVSDAEEVKKNWEQLKLREGKKSVLEGVPKSLPAMVKATRIQEKVKEVGFDWEDASGVLEKVMEEIHELEMELEAGNKEKAESELGDVLFSIINYARFLEIDPEMALERTNKKFISRFQSIESKAQEKGKNIKELTLGEMEEIWQESKNT